MTKLTYLRAFIFPADIVLTATADPPLVEPPPLEKLCLNEDLLDLSLSLDTFIATFGNAVAVNEGTCKHTINKLRRDFEEIIMTMLLI
jgi:hypothetical protein